jgi:hypothetical protein
MTKICCPFLRRHRMQPPYPICYHPTSLLLPRCTDAESHRCRLSLLVRSSRCSLRSPPNGTAVRWLDGGALTPMWVRMRGHRRFNDSLYCRLAPLFLSHLGRKLEMATVLDGAMTGRWLCSTETNGCPSDWNRRLTQVGLAFGLGVGRVCWARPLLRPGARNRPWIELLFNFRAIFFNFAKLYHF